MCAALKAQYSVPNASQVFMQTWQARWVGKRVEGMQVCVRLCHNTTSQHGMTLPEIPATTFRPKTYDFDKQGSRRYVACMQPCKPEVLKGVEFQCKMRAGFNMQKDFTRTNVLRTHSSSCSRGTLLKRGETYWRGGEQYISCQLERTHAQASTAEGCL